MPFQEISMNLKIMVDSSTDASSRNLYESEDNGGFLYIGARCSSVVGAFAHGAMGRRIDPSWGGPIELFLVPASAPQLL